MTLITGNTYPVKDALKAMGAKWDGDAKGWRVPEAKASEAQKLVAGAPQAKGNGKCKKCGGKVSGDWLICYPCKFGTGTSTHSHSNNAPGGRVCDYCGSRECARAWNPRDLCDED